MQQNYFLLVTKFKNTESDQLCNDCAPYQAWLAG